MDKNGTAFQKRLLATFRVEAGEHLQALSAGLIALEQAGAGAEGLEIVERVFREAHSLKGAARAVGKGEIESLCQGLEGVFARLKGREIELSPSLSELLDQALALLGSLLAGVEGEAPRGQGARLADCCRRLGAAVAAGPTKEPTKEQAAGAEAAPAAAPYEPAPAPGLPTAETVRVPVSRLEAILFEAEALLAAKLAGHQRVADLRELQGMWAGLKRERARVGAEVRGLQRRLERREGGGQPLPGLRKILDYQAWEEGFIKSFEARLGALVRASEQAARGLDGTTDGLLGEVKKALMLPIAAAIEALPRFVRDFARSEGKEVEFTVSGGEIEIDRRILEELRDPILHLVRNSLDHGIEAPPARGAAGKPRRGRIDVAAGRIEGSRIEITVADDGAGIDPAAVRAAARKLGLAAAETAADEAGDLNLAFLSGVSTRPIITDLSGRGLGLAIVREKVERLGGTVALASQPGAGTTVHIVLPLTLATFRGVHVQAGGQDFIFPTMHLDGVRRVARGDIRHIENRESLRFEGEVLALAPLAETLGIPAGPAAGGAGSKVQVVVAAAAGTRVAFRVDAVIGEQEVLVKGLGRQLRRVRNIAGATVLGSGQVVPILDVPDLLQSALRAPPPAAVAAADAGARGKTVLVAEDSITSRQLLKGILETAGYTVATAVDGMDAYTRLRSESFDLLVSDVDMPRMNGFDLTTRIRAEPALADLPVVLVTALGSREDRERGADVGANAYIVKSSFDQSNLLAVIRRLL